MRINLDEALAISRFQQRNRNAVTMIGTDLQIGVPLMRRVRACLRCAQQVLVEMQRRRLRGRAVVRVMGEGNRHHATGNSHPSQGDPHLIGTGWRSRAARGTRLTAL
jgi:hypothetical protein